ncbi:MAG: hypothetical protein AAF604_12265 [Acidobacteriota bacterium]
MANSLESLIFALEKYPQQVEAAPLAELLIESARQTDKRPAYVKLAVPDAVVKSLRGSRAGDLLLMVRVPKEVVDRQGSSIILPGEAD